MIFCITGKEDEHADIVLAELDRKGAPYVRFHTAEFPQQILLTGHIQDDVGSDRVVLNVSGQTINLSDIKTVWFRRPKSPELPSELSEEDHEFAMDESTAVLRSLWCLLRDCFWVNPRLPGTYAESKLYQLELARSIGFDVPRTLITNDPAEIAPFFERCDGNAIYKTFTQHTRTTTDGGLAIYTSVLTAADLKRVDSLKVAPGIFQQYVPKKVELRVTVIGRKVFAAEIHSQNSERAKIDWRRYDLPNTPHLQHELPREVEERCLEFVRQMGLVFGCIDLILTPAGNYVFLENNPNGQWHWVERMTGLPLLDNFTEMLIQATAEYADPDVSDTRGAIEA